MNYKRSGGSLVRVSGQREAAFDHQHPETRTIGWVRGEASNNAAVGQEQQEENSTGPHATHGASCDLELTTL